MRGPVGFSLRQTVVAVGAGVSVTLVASNPSRKYLAIRNTGTQQVTLGVDGAAVGGSGYPLGPAATSGGPGEGLSWEAGGVPQGRLDAITNTGTTTVVVLEGV